jgi:Holliday junction resolvase RusA-like endonuclease
VKRAITIYGNPIGKPRMTRADKWKQRTCVMQYRAWADVIRSLARTGTKITLQKPTVLTIRAFFKAPDGAHRTGPHTHKPDFDNVEKAVADALFQNDQMIYKASVEKLWADGSQPRVEVEWF